MKKLTQLLFTALFFLAPKMFAQFAKVVDKDGFVNMRSEATAKSKIVAKIKSGEMVYIFNKGDDFGNWLIVDYENEKKDLLTGYVHNSKLKSLDTYEEIPSVITDENGANFVLRNIVVEIKTGKFDFKKNEKYFTRNKDTNYFEKYKGQNFWGFNTSIPKTCYKSISVNIGQKKIEIPRKEIENFFEVNNELTKVFYDAKTDTLYIISSNADGSDSYYVLFTIKNGKYSGRKAYSAN